jgi:predicted lipid-binding transport protein (Tim44 family)
VAAVLMLAAGAAEARPGKSSSGMGSRGSRTYDAAPPTSTAPRTTAPMERSMAQPGQPGAAQGLQRPGAPAPSGGFFSRGSGFMTGLMGGLIGAGIGGLLFGSGLFGGLGGFASFLGLLLQFALIGGLVWLAIRFFRRRSEPAYAGAGAPLQRQAAAPGHAGDGAAGTAGPAASGAGMNRDEIGLEKQDYDDFERLLGEIQEAWSRQDLAGLRQMATPEMVSYFAEELAEYASRGLTNRVTGARLLQGDLAEAWREGNLEYATVAMRFAFTEWTTDSADRVVEGDPNQPTEATEVWTFMRSRGGRWLLSAIQQAEPAAVH